MCDRLRIIQGDALTELAKLPAESVHCCVSSPPYWGLRDYGVPGQLGLEETPEEYVANMVAVFRELRRVLREDGTVWLNLGDSYAAAGGHTKAGASGLLSSMPDQAAQRNRGTTSIPEGFKQKDLIGIPWRVALALQADGWWLRQDIIWHKPNPMPESVTDRCTKAHEYIFLLTKSARYFFDAEAIKERGVIPEGTLAAKGSEERFNTAGVNSRPPEYKEYSGYRNKRSVWMVTTEPYSGAHFAVFPTDLIKPCILAGTSAKGCCPKCGAPWERIVISDNPSKKENTGEDMTGGAANTRNPQTSKGLHRNNGGVYSSAKECGWQPTCDCGEVTVIPCTILDPFGGSGTTGMVSVELGRKAILIELNPKYVELANKRCHVTPGLALA